MTAPTVIRSVRTRNRRRDCRIHVDDHLENANAFALTQSDLIDTLPSWLSVEPRHDDLHRCDGLLAGQQRHQLLSPERSFLPREAARCDTGVEHDGG